MTEATPELSFRYEETVDHDPEINPATDYLIECKRCGEFRHKSWFQVNWPACAACMQFDKLFLENLTTELIMRDPHGIMPPVPAWAGFVDCGYEAQAAIASSASEAT